MSLHTAIKISFLNILIGSATTELLEKRLLIDLGGNIVADHIGWLLKESEVENGCNNSDK